MSRLKASSKPPSGAPPHAPASRTDARRRLYLDVARRLFAAHGFAGTSTDMIVAEAGGSKATLYKYFPSKESLITGIIDAVSARVSQGHPAFSAEHLDLREALMQIGRATLDGVISDAAVDVLRLSLGEYHRFPELARTVWEHGPAVTYDNFKRFLAQRRSLGELDYEDPQLAAEHFVAGIVGHIQLKVAMGICEPPDDRECTRRVTAAVETFLARYAG